MTCLSTSTQVTITVSGNSFSGLYTYFHFHRICEEYRLLQARRSLYFGCLEDRFFFVFHFSSVYGLVFHFITNSVVVFYLLNFFYLKLILSQLLIVFGETLQKDFRVFQKCFYWPKSVLLLYPY